MHDPADRTPAGASLRFATSVGRGGGAIFTGTGSGAVCATGAPIVGDPAGVWPSTPQPIRQVRMINSTTAATPELLGRGHQPGLVIWQAEQLGEGRPLRRAGTKRNSLTRNAT